MIDTLGKVSNKSVVKATGQSWEYWINYLNKRSSGKLPHREIVRLLEAEVESAWWRQKIAVAYEEYTGARVLGQTPEGFEIGVSRTIEIPQQDLWNFIISEEGMRLWLGDMAELNFREKGEYRTLRDISGQFNVIKNLSHIRMTWKPEEWNNPSVLQVRAVAKGNHKATLSFHQEKLPDQAAREKMKQRWKAIANEMQSALEK